MNQNNGMGKVIVKDELVMGHENNIQVAAVRHGNGKDWWLCTNNTGTNCWTVGLDNGGANMDTAVYCGGVGAISGEILSSRFSPDGSKFISGCTSSDINMFNFDRCNGTLTLQEHFVIPEIADSMYWWPTSIEFSTDSRFVYIFCNDRIFQFDMQANPIVSSKKVIAKYQGFLGPFPVDYYGAQLAPDGKIYVNSGNGANYLG